MKHTQGKWTSYFNEILVDGNPVASVYGNPSDEEVKANVRLIKLAPKLLEMCRMLDGYTNHKKDTLPYYQGLDVFLKNIKQVIAEAEEV